MSSAAGAAGLQQLYRFKDICAVLPSDALIDTVLSKTQRKTPTVVHPQYDIRRIRSFYMRKVKFTAQSFHEKFEMILSQFPLIDSIHPFYADLSNILYNRDHYKLALGQIHKTMNLIDTLASEYVRLLKFADSPYKCKMVKRAALGRMCTAVTKLKNTLPYLEEVRKNLSRLPAINVYNNTLLLAGHPNVGKSTFMNVLSNANVEVADWAFTTQSLYLGHFSYNFEDWQVIDTPGVLDRPLSNRNTIEMVSITALAHLPAAVLFLIDISGSCGFTIAQQVDLFKSLKPLLAHKPVVVVLNKIDAVSFDLVSAEEKELIQSCANGIDRISFVETSTLKQLNLDKARNIACELLLNLKKEKRLLAGKSVSSEPAQITRTALNPNRPVMPMPEPDIALSDRPNILEEVEANGGCGVYGLDQRSTWKLENSEWLYDDIPEIMDGVNIVDYVDPDIESKLRALEEEEREIEASWNPALKAPTAEWKDYQKQLKEMFIEAEAKRTLASMKRSSNDARRAMDPDKFRARMKLLGVDVEDVLSRIKQMGDLPEGNVDAGSAASDSCFDSDSDSDIEQEGDTHVASASSTDVKRAKARVRSAKQFALSRRQGAVGETARAALITRDRRYKGLGSESRLREVQKKIFDVEKRYRKPSKGQCKWQINESDRFIGTKIPKHLFSGKRGIGKADRR